MSNIQTKPRNIRGFFDEGDFSPPNEKKDVILNDIFQDIYDKASFKDGRFQKNTPSKITIQNGETRNVDNAQGNQRIYIKIEDRLFFMELTEVR